MVEIIKIYKQFFPKTRFIGKKHSNPSAWAEWFQNGWFDLIENAVGLDKIHDLYEDSDAYIGLIKHTGDLFEYWIGMFCPEDAPVPDGFEAIDFSYNALGVCWIYGPESEVYACIRRCYDEVSKTLEIIAKGGITWSFERYGCPRFTTPDEKGNVILDYCFFVK